MDNRDEPVGVDDVGVKSADVCGDGRGRSVALRKIPFKNLSLPEQMLIAGDSQSSQRILQRVHYCWGTAK